MEQFGVMTVDENRGIVMEVMFVEGEYVPLNGRLYQLPNEKKVLGL